MESSARDSRAGGAGPALSDLLGFRALVEEDLPAGVALDPDRASQGCCAAPGRLISDQRDLFGQDGRAEIRNRDEHHRSALKGFDRLLLVVDAPRAPELTEFLG